MATEFEALPIEPGERYLAERGGLSASTRRESALRGGAASAPTFA
jgi:hypothetical protein